MLQQLREEQVERTADEDVDRDVPDVKARDAVQADPVGECPIDRQAERQQWPVDDDGRERRARLWIEEVAPRRPEALYLGVVADPVDRVEVRLVPQRVAEHEGRRGGEQQHVDRSAGTSDAAHASDDDRPARWPGDRAGAPHAGTRRNRSMLELTHTNHGGRLVLTLA